MMRKTTVFDWYKKKTANGKLFMVLFAMSLLFASITLAGTPSAATKEPQGDPKRSYGAIDVILYQTSWCPYCTKAKKFLQETGVSLKIYDIEKEPDRAAEMRSKSGSTGVPVVDIEGIIIPGYSVEAMRSAIERKRRE